MQRVCVCVCVCLKFPRCKTTILNQTYFLRGLAQHRELPHDFFACQ